jgi:hypothetical protein
MENGVIYGFEEDSIEEGAQLTYLLFGGVLQWT